MVNEVKKKKNSITPTVRFTGLQTISNRRQSKLSSENSKARIDNNKFTSSRLWIISTIVLICAITFLAYRGYLDTQSVNYPYPGPKVVQHDKTFWGTYRPGVYFGLRTKESLEKGSVAAGLMWYSQHDLINTGSIESIRHMCDNAHNDLIYSYIEHDAINYGHQFIKDGIKNGYTLQTIFLRPNDETLDFDTGTDWTTRIIYETNNTKLSVSLVWYIYIDPGENENSLNSQDYSVDTLKDVNNKLDKSITIIGKTPSLNDFQMSIIPIKTNINEKSNQYTVYVNTSISRMHCPNTAMLRNCVARSMIIKQQSIKQQHGMQILLSDQNNDKTSNHINNFIAIQITVTHSIKSLKSMSKIKNFSYSFDVAYTQKNKILNTPSLIGNTFNLVHAEYSKRFQQKFENSFPITFNHNTIEKDLLLNFAKVTFSNMAGSLGYFYGSSLVRDDNNNKYYNKDISNAVKYWKAGLLTVVPSRSQFPRGFLWDDGFHGLLLGSWNIDLELNILGHWMDLLNYQGWIPREQILGSEARSKVPEEFIIQSSQAANPPALLLTVDLLLKQIKRQKLSSINNYQKNINFEEIDKILIRLYPRLKAWFMWFNRTQRAVNSKRSPLTTNSQEFVIEKSFIGYRWRGRDAGTNKELNPKTLTSGMDDYPRSSHPVNNDGTSNIFNNANLDQINEFISERHVDLHCWISHSVRIMNNLQNYLQKSNKINFDHNYSMQFWMLVESLDRLHWTVSNSNISKIQMYADFGVHTDDVRLEKIKNMDDEIRIVGRKDPPKWRFVDSHIGYNALFPMFFRLVKDSQRLNAILDLIEGLNNNNLAKDTGLLTKGCGLRSLSKSSPLYKVKNTMHDPPYWRGSIWINMQYLVCSSLYYYANLPDNTKYTNFDDNEHLEPIQYLDIKTKKRCKQLYDKIRNDVIQCVYKEWIRTGYIWEQYEDIPIWDKTHGFIHVGKGTRPFTGWSANVVLLMAEIY